MDDKYKAKTGTRSSGLLRLFRSDLFNEWMALHYLYKQDEIGIHYYICEKMRSLLIKDIDLVLPQLCHLAVTKRISSASLEYFLVDLSRQYVHISAQLLWLLESYFNDFYTERDEMQERSLKRAVHLIQEIQSASFSKEAILGGGDTSCLSQIRRRRSYNDKIDSPGKHGLDELPSVFGSFLGFGVSLMSFAAPELFRTMQGLALIQSRTLKYSAIYAAINCKSKASATRLSADPSTAQQASSRSVLAIPFNASSPSIEELHKGNAFDNLQRMFERTKRRIRREPAGQAVASCAVVPSSFKFLYHVEMQFATSLLEISKRLCHVPSKESRQKSLYAELDLINNNLPANICLSLFCEQETSGLHHGILRIPVREATILNSAERVPYLVFVEVARGMTQEGLESLKELCSCELFSEATGSASISDGASESDPACSDDLIEARTPIFEPGQADNSKAEQMRIAAIMLAQLSRQANIPGANLDVINNIRDKIFHEIESMEREGMVEALSAHSPSIVDDSQTASALIVVQNPTAIKEDPSSSVFKEQWEVKKQRIRQASPFGSLDEWDLLSVVVKAGVDMRQERFACQLIRTVQSIFDEEGIECWTSPHHNVLVAGSEGGLIETVPNTISIHSIKKSVISNGNGNHVCSLKEFFGRKFGSPSSDEYKGAVLNFIRSLAGYSLITYVLYIKDRHNGNILIDSSGHIIHIDFGFMLSNAPGSNYIGGFETAPFKLTSDYIEILGNLNWNSLEYKMFRGLFLSGFMAIRKHQERLLTIIQCAQSQSTMPCFVGREAVISQLKNRLFLGVTDRSVEQNVDKLILSSAFNLFTRLYDSYQYYSNGIL